MRFLFYASLKCIIMKNMFVLSHKKASMYTLTAENWNVWTISHKYDAKLGSGARQYWSS